MVKSETDMSGSSNRDSAGTSTKLCTGVSKRIALSESMNASECPSKRHRRSSTKRKSLVDTLQYLSNSLQEVHSSSSAPTTEAIQQQKADSVSETSTTELPVINDANNPSVAGVESDCIHEVDAREFLINWYSTLQREVSSWKDLLQKYKNEEQTKRESSFDNLDDDKECVCSQELYNRTGSINYHKFTAEIQSLQERFKAAVKSVMHNADTVLEIYNEHESLLQLRINEEMKTRPDPKVLIEKIFVCDDLLEGNYRSVRMPRHVPD